jgi:Uma2 family endonuclease
MPIPQEDKKYTYTDYLTWPPSSTKMDKVLKFNKYEKAGIKEYWIVEPDGKIVSVFTLQDTNRYGRPETYTEEEQIQVAVFLDLVIDLKSVFAAV